MASDANDKVIVPDVSAVLDATDDLVAATQTTLDFWDSPYDDQDWSDT